MSFHGGLLGRGHRAWLFCPQAQARYLALADLLAVVAPIGLFFRPPRQFRERRVVGQGDGRALGDGVLHAAHPPDERRLPGRPAPRHPSQLYEAALEGLLLFVVLQIGLRVFRLQERPGLLTGIFLAGYGVFRVYRRILPRSERSFLGWFSMGMALSIPMWAGGRLLLLVRGAPKTARERARPAHRGADRGAGSDLRRAIHDDGAARSGHGVLRDARRIGRRAISSPRRKSARCSAN